MCVHASVPVQVRIMGILMVHGRVRVGHGAQAVHGSARSGATVLDRGPGRAQYGSTVAQNDVSSPCAHGV